MNQAGESTNQINNNMGQCMPSSNTPSIHHPVMGPLTVVIHQQTTLYELTLPVLNQEHYMEWVKDISKLKFNPTIVDYLYLPISENYQHQQTSCSSFNDLTIRLPTYSCTLPQMIKKRSKEQRFFTELELWHVIVLFLKCFIYGQQKRQNIVRADMENMLITHDGHLRIIPHILLQDRDLSNHVFVLKDHHSDKTSATLPEDSSVHKAALICLQMATLSPIKQDEQSDEQILRERMAKGKQRYSTTLMQQLSTMLFECLESSIFLQKLYKKAEPFVGQIQQNMQLGIKFGQYQPVNQGQSLRFLERGTPKMSRACLHEKIENNLCSCHKWKIQSMKRGKPA